MLVNPNYPVALRTSTSKTSARECMRCFNLLCLSAETELMLCLECKN